MHRLIRREVAAREDGAIAIVVALFAVALFGFAALVVDVGNGQNVRTQAQNAVDSAALAGVRALANGGDVVTTVKQYVGYSARTVDWSGCADPDHLSEIDPTDPTNECISWEASPPEANGHVSYRVRVKFPPSRVPEAFAGAFGGGAITVSPIAEAASGQLILPPCEPCDPSIGPDLQPAGSPSPSPAPSFASPTATPTPPGPDGPCELQPGTYSNGSDVSFTGSCTLSPGLYVFDDSNLSIDGAISGSNVTLVFEHSGTIDVRGTLSLAATPADQPAVAGDVPGLAVFFDAGDSQTFHLGASFNISGSVLALEAKWATKPGDCQPMGSCSLKPGVLSVAHTDFSDMIQPQVSNQPSPSPAPAHLSK